MDKLAEANRLMLVGNTLRYKRYVEDFPVYLLDNVWNDTTRSGFGRKKQYVVETSPKVVERCVLMTTAPGDLVLDPTCGSGTTAFVGEQWGRPRSGTACASSTRARAMRASTARATSSRRT